MIAKEISLDLFCSKECRIITTLGAALQDVEVRVLAHS